MTSRNSPRFELNIPAGKSRALPLVMLVLSFAIAFLLHLLLFGTAPMVSAVMAEMSLSHAEFGFIFSVAMVSLVLFRIPWGMFGDRVGYLNALRIALPLVAASAVLRAFCGGYVTLLWTQFGLGLGLAAILPCLPLLVKEWVPKATGMATGIYMAGFAAGNATALGLTPRLLEMMEWRHVLMVYGGLALLVCGLWWALARSRIKATSGLRLENLGRILRERRVWLLLLLVMVSMGSYDTLATWMPKVLEVKHLDPSLASLLPLGFFVAGPVIGFTSDRFHKRRVMLAMLGAVASLSIMGINYVPYPLLPLFIFLSGFTAVGALTIALALPAEDQSFSGSVATVVGVISSLGNVGPLLMPVVFGFLVDITDSIHASILSVALLAGTTFILGRWVSEPGD